MKKVLFAFILILALGAGLFVFRDKILPGTGESDLRIVLNTPASSMSPFALNLNNETRIRNFYEGLVVFDQNLKISPALAVSWGNLSDTEWEFKLREGVYFHDGSPFSAQDVLDVFQKAKKSGNSQVAPYIDTIEDIAISDNNRLIIRTIAPDPLLLSKLTKLLIYHDGNIGTGPYKFVEWVPGNHLTLEAFPDYWGTMPAYQKVYYDVISNRTQREEEFKNGDIDILVGLTEGQALELPEEQIVNGYGLEVAFLMFQMSDPLFQDRSLREAILSLIDPDRIEAIGNHFVRRTNQFVAQGVFGYNSRIPEYTYSPEKEAQDLFGNRLERLNFDYLSSYVTLSEYLTEQLRKAGFSVKGSAIQPDDLMTKISQNKSQFFLLGWRAEDGDAGGFFDAFVHSKGPFNNGRYVNAELDKLIEASRTEMNPQKRLSLLQEINTKVSEELIGIPLFETSRLYAIGKGITWEARGDGLVLAAEVKR